MGFIKNSFNELLESSEHFIQVKNNLQKLVESINELATSMVNLAQTVQAHHIAINEILLFQSEIIKHVSQNDDLFPPFDDDIQLN